MTLLGTLQPPLTALVATSLLGERLDPFPSFRPATMREETIGNAYSIGHAACFSYFTSLVGADSSLSSLSVLSSRLIDTFNLLPSMSRT